MPQSGDIGSSQVSLEDVNNPCMLVSGDAIGGSSADIKGIKLKLDATAAPTGAASFAAGYAVGSLWLWAAQGRLFVCTGDAIWEEIAQADVLTAHTSNTSNPHSVSAAQVGAKVSGDVETVATGGTGLNTLTAAGRLLYSTSASAMAALAAGSNGHYLTLSSGLPAWAALSVSLTTQVTGTLSATNGGTGQSTLTTGDMLYASATNTISKRAIGSESQVLTVVSGVPNWADPPGSDPSGGTYITTISARVTTTGSVQTVGSQYLNVAAGNYLFRFAGAVASGATCKLGYKINSGSDVFPTNSDTVNAVFSVPITLALNDDITFRAQVSNATNYLSLEVWLMS